MSPEYMSENNFETDDLGRKSWESQTRPSEPFGRWSRWDLDRIRGRVRDVFDEMIENERFKKRNPVFDPSTQFQIDAEKELIRDVADLEANEPTHANLGAASEPIGISNQRSEQPEDRLE